jgi:hypothetical protein
LSSDIYQLHISNIGDIPSVTLQSCGYIGLSGFHDLESVKQGCLTMWEMLKNNHCDRVVNDNTHVLGNWSEAAEWVGTVWFPMMEKAGLKYFAHVFSPSTFSQLRREKASISWPVLSLPNTLRMSTWQHNGSIQ